MATLYISEHSEMPLTDNSVGKSWAMAPSIVDQTVAIGASSTASNAFNVNTRFVRLDAGAICSVAFSAAGATPTATASNARMAANTTEYFGVQGGGKVAVITNS